MSRDKRPSKRKEEEDPPPAKVAIKKRKVVSERGQTTAAPSSLSSPTSYSPPSSKTPPKSNNNINNSNNNNPFSFKNPAYNRPIVKKRQTWKNLKQILAAEPYSQLPVNVATYVNIEAAPSLMAVKKYCDISGLPSPYKDPSSGIRYSSSSVYKYIKTLPDDTIQQYLGLRKAAVDLK